MTTFTRDERNKLNECIYRINEDIKNCDKIVASYKKEDSSFDYLYFLERLKTAASNGTNSYVKVSRQVNSEAKSLVAEPSKNAIWASYKSPIYIDLNIQAPIEFTIDEEDNNPF